MKVFVFVHPDTDAFWTQVTLGGIADEIARKRYTAEYLQDKDVRSIDFDRVFAGEKKRLLLYLGNSPLNLPRDLRHLAANGVHAVLANHETDLLFGNCSKVLLDYRGGMHRSICYLTANGRDRIAFFGVNPSSSTDLLKKNFFAEYLQKKGGSVERDIYFNHADIESCIAAFLRNYTLYNAVICANDIVALALIRACTERGVRVPEDLYVASCGGSSLVTEAAQIPVTSVFADQHEVGRQAVLAYATLYKNHCDVALTFRVRAKLTVRASTAFAPDPGEIFDAPDTSEQADVNFYTDPTVHRLLTIETLLKSCDELDRDIILGLLRGETYPSLAAKLYTSENVIAYRVKRMGRVTGTSGREELTALLASYLHS